VAGFTLGYPDENPLLRDRLPLDGLVHYETYQDYNDERITEIYREREVKGWDRYMSYPRLRKLIIDSGVENLAQVYTEVKYSRKSHQEFSRRVLNYLKLQNYMNQ
jgi:hypothetical protein